VYKVALDLPEGVSVEGVIRPGFEKVLTREALAFVADLQRRFNARREELLQARVERQKRLDEGEKPDFLADTASIREGDWTVAPLPQDILDRRVEIVRLGGAVAARLFRGDLVARWDREFRARLGSYDIGAR